MNQAASAPQAADSAALAHLIAESEALTQFLYMAPVGLVQIDESGTISMINPISAQLLMPLSSDGELVNLYDALASVAPDLRSMVRAFRPPSGNVCDGLRLHVRPFALSSNEPQVLSLSLVKLEANRMMAVLTDITQQVRRERLLRQSDAWLNAILTGISDYALVHLDAHGRVDAWNASIERVTGFTADQVLGRPYSIFYAPDATTPERVVDRLRDADDDGWSMDDGWRVRADGSRFWGSAMIAPLQDKAPPESIALHPDLLLDKAYCLVIRDITDKRDAAEQQRRMTSCDHLTGIANRRAFFEAAELELRRWHRSPRPLSLLMIDVDHFKRINDTFGHAAGDAALQHIANVLSGVCRDVDLVARLGGEEFAVLLPSTDQAQACTVATRVQQALATRVADVDGHAVSCTVSGGIATMDTAVGGLDDLMKRADEALYAAKRNGRDRFECWTTTQARSLP